MNKAKKFCNTKTKGAYHEDMALLHLLNLGFILVERNFYTRYGEIDLIMQKDSVLHFIEVKSSSSFNPLLNITHKKLERLTKSISIFLSDRGLDCDFCLDAISIYRGRIEFIENITLYI